MNKRDMMSKKIRVCERNSALATLVGIMSHVLASHILLQVTTQ